MNNTTNHPLISLAVIGHTNVGKTSLMRTLTRDDSFGEVKNTSATTRHVEKVVMGDDEQNLIQLSDTPGLEDATGLMDYLAEHTNARADGVTRLSQLLEDFKSQAVLQQFSQEIKVIDAVLANDIALYVIDARFAPTAKYQDELSILAMTGVPILPAFNFVKDGQYIDEWRQTLSRRALHISNEFDTVAFDFDNEIKLWQNLSTLTHQPAALAQFIAHRTKLWQNLYDEGNLIISDFLVNIASYTIKAHEDDNPTPINTAMQTKVRQAYQHTYERLLNAYKFYNKPIHLSDDTINIHAPDPFDASFIAQLSLRTAGGSAAGATLGAAFDVASLGTSLGAGTLIGVLIGGGAANYGTIKDKITHQKHYRIDDDALLVMASQLNTLHHAIRHTGHASLDAIHLDSTDTVWQKLPKALVKARQKPHYSSLADNKDKYELRADLAYHLAGEIF